MYSVARRFYRYLPRRVRSWIARTELLASLKEYAKRLLASATPAYKIYDEHFYKQRAHWDLRGNALVMADALVSVFQPSSVLDAGCGSGELLEALQSMGISAMGLEVSRAALEICKKKGLDVRQCDLARDSWVPERKYDLVVSFEVAEHLPEKTAGHYVEMLTQAGQVCVISAAPPGQTGEGHVNEQPREYWVDKFQKRGWWYDAKATEVLSEMWKEGGVKTWYYRNVMCFRCVPGREMS